MDIVYIRDLRIDTVIGVYSWERAVRQTLHFDLQLATDVAHAASGDLLADALDYSTLTARLEEFVRASDCQLIETLAERCAHFIRNEFGVSWLKLRLEKPGALSAAATVGIEIERGSRA